MIISYIRTSIHYYMDLKFYFIIASFAVVRFRVSGQKAWRMGHRAWGKGLKIQVRHLGIEGFRDSGIKRY